MYDDFVEKLVVGVGVTLIVLLLTWATIKTVYQTKVERICLVHGYPQGDWRVIGPNYCIKRVNQTDVVTSLDSL